MSRHPLVFLWVAFYDNNKCLPQFDVESGEEYFFKDIVQERLVKFALFPLSKEAEEKINKKAEDLIVKSISGLPHFVLELKPNQRLIYVRRNFIHQFKYQFCSKCMFKWQWMPNNPKKISEVGLPISQKHIVQTYKGKKYPLPVCPKCGTTNFLLCPTCETLINEYEREDKSHYLQCPKCKRGFHNYVKFLGDEKRKIVYLLGYQTTVKGKNKKHVMFINEDGTFKLGDDFNAL